MTVLALLQSLAALCIASDESATLPIFAKSDLVSKEVRSASKVLKVVSVDTLRLVVVLIERAPFSFEVKHEEVEIELVN